MPVSYTHLDVYKRQIETIDLELIFSDMEILERRIAKTTKSAMGNKALTKELEILKAMYAHLEEGKLARSYETEDEDELAFIATLNLLTWKPVIFAANVAEDDLSDDGASNEYVQAVRNFAAENDSEVFVICAQIEQEIAEPVSYTHLADRRKLPDPGRFHLLPISPGTLKRPLYSRNSSGSQ